MKVFVDEFLLCAYMCGFKDIRGFQEIADGIDFEKYDEKEFSERLLNSELLEKVDADNADVEKVVAPLAQLYMTIMSEPDSWVVIKNIKDNAQRYIYVKDFDFIKVDVEDEYMSITLLPTIEIMIGAYAVTWPGFKEAPSKDSLWDRDSIIYSMSGEVLENKWRIDICENGIGNLQFSDTEEHTAFSEEYYTNKVTGWMLEKLFQNGDK